MMVHRLTYMCTYIRFKLACHHLTIVTGRWHGAGIDHADRVCQHMRIVMRVRMRSTMSGIWYFECITSAYCE